MFMVQYSFFSALLLLPEVFKEVIPRQQQLFIPPLSSASLSASPDFTPSVPPLPSSRWKLQCEWASGQFATGLTLPPPAVLPVWPTLLWTTPGLPSPNCGWKDGPLREVRWRCGVFFLMLLLMVCWTGHSGDERKRGGVGWMWSQVDGWAVVYWFSSDY